MNRKWSVIWIIALVITLVGCGKTDYGTNALSITATNTKETQVVHENANTEGSSNPLFADEQYTEQDIFSMFHDMSNNESKYEYKDCVLVSDHAYGFIGAVLFCDNHQGTSNVAFFEKDGFYQECATFAKLSDHAEFTYLGDGTVSFQLEETGGEVSTIKFTYTSDNNGNICWIVNNQ